MKILLGLALYWVPIVRKNALLYRRNIKWIFEMHTNGLDYTTHMYHWKCSPRISGTYTNYLE